ncbi:MAG: NADPH-dependent oxidoreductase, partial [SAR324 cluster bacterium]|nr:NADPH-dependent oxidoreductase [SAR324 cluster bacterium]
MNNPITDHIKNHRSIRRFEDRPLPKGLVEELVTCGQSASTSSNLQAYSVIEVSDPKRKKALAELCADQVQIHQSPTFLVFCADLNRDRLAGQLHGVENFDTDYVEALLIATVDAALVLQNVALAAESHGLGICMIGAIRIHPKAVGKLLNLPPLVYAVAGLCLGYPAKDQQQKPRLPLETILHHEQYSEDNQQIGHIKGYDQTMVEFYSSQAMHDKDPRWSKVMAARTARFHER